ncbi:hypothetical protein [Streptomyces sp. NPDC018584]|uniref:hypothetical protein n=1 Tax=unclassified Streptomyces TaxID=2593676 RepID=UPI0037B5D8C7
MIHITETVGVGSIENFLSDAERTHLADLMNDVLTNGGTSASVMSAAPPSTKSPATAPKRP